MESQLATDERGACVERSDDAILGGAERQLDERRVTEKRGEPARERRLGRSLLPSQQHASDVAIDTRDAQRELRVVLTDDSVERKDVHLASS
jgi:hypothetical protein